MKRLFRWQTLVCMLVGVLVASCAMDQRFSIPGTTAGGDPDPGENGKSAYDLWLEELRAGDINNFCTGEPWDAEDDQLMDFFEWLRGCNGTNGTNGDTPYIGDDGDWWIGDTDTGVPATGPKGDPGDDGLTPEIGPNGNWFIGGEDTGKPSRGEDGKPGATPEIGDNGNWWIDGEDTGKPSRGDDGDNGDTPYIGDDGDWWIGDVDTGVPARGQNGEPGDNGTPGLSAYDLWKIEALAGKVKDCDGKEWMAEAGHGASEKDYYDWLKGCKGDKGDSAYDLWLNDLKTPGLVKNMCTGEDWNPEVDGDDLKDFYKWLQGCTPHIGDNGNWWFGTVDTGKPSQGDDGAKGDTPRHGDDGYWYFGDVKTEFKWEGEKGDDGANGFTPEPNPDGYWYINGVKTIFMWKGEQGIPGLTPEPGEDGYWYIGGEKTEHKWEGEDGENGFTPEPRDDGFWWIGGVNTGLKWKGEDGKSAYDLWKDWVEAQDGSVTDCEGVQWPDTPDKTEMDDFIEWLDGCDGDDGQAGESAYDHWVGMVKAGSVKDCEGNTIVYKEDGSVTKVSDFEKWLNGCDGKSAYELWVIDVTDADGLKDPYENTPWPTTEISEADFWRYLRGRDGKDGKDGNDGKPGAPGTPGESITEIKQIGKPNVLANYVNEPNSEFVDWLDGTVTYTVFNEKGEIAVGATVTDIPGLPGKTYTSGTDGKFTVEPEDLPRGMDIDDRFGSCTVTYFSTTEQETVTEPSAYNTYVPERIDIRLRVTDPPLISYNGVYNQLQYIYFVVERSVEADSEWERIPSYLGNLTQNVYVYSLEDKEDPSSFNPETSKQWRTGTSFNISTTSNVYFPRPLKIDDALESTYSAWANRAWSGEDTYVTLQLRQYYGQIVNTDAVFKVAPFQRQPYIKSATASYFKDLETGDVVERIEGELDVAYVDYNLLFEKRFSKSPDILGPNNKYYNLYEPVVMDTARANSIPVFRVTFAEGEYAVYNETYASLGNPKFVVDKVTYLNSKVKFSSNTTNNVEANPAATMFYSEMDYAKFTGTGTTDLNIVNDDTSAYVLPDVIVNYVEKP